MNVFQKLKSRQRDMKILSALIESSLERSAKASEQLAGAHQLALAAFDMPDGVAERSLIKLGSSGSAFAETLASLEIETLADLGLEAPPPNGDAPSRRQPRLGSTDATFESAIKAIYEFHNGASDYRALNGAHVLAGVATVERGVSARVFSAMTLDRGAVIDACRAEF